MQSVFYVIVIVLSAIVVVDTARLINRRQGKDKRIIYLPLKRYAYAGFAGLAVGYLLYRAIDNLFVWPDFIGAVLGLLVGTVVIFGRITHSSQ
ncbi:MAG TPA: hypothetical protein VFM05_08655 [Candidatus Saccharimonadales bacterium]|nr:hypothetical protein [Candidatus Saccharimonadales bacterium]